MGTINYTTATINALLAKVQNLNVNVVTVSTNNTSAQNVAAIQAALNVGGNINIWAQSTGGNLVDIPLSSTLVIKSNTNLTISDDIRLYSDNGRVSPTIKNKYAGHIAPSEAFSRTSNVVTVLETGHTRAVGDIIAITGGGDSSFRGIVTITANSSTTWSYSSSGSNGGAGTGNYYNVIPIRRSIAGSSFTSVSGAVTVTDSGHKLVPGMNIYLINSNGSAFAPGKMVTVAKVSPSTWTYYVAGLSSGTDSGTTYLSYDNSIVISGGIIDGNRQNLGNPMAGYEMQLTAAFFGGVSDLTINSAIGGSSIRAMSLFNCSDVRLGHEWCSFDTLVGAQFEGGAAGVTIDSRTFGAAQFNSASAQQADDYVAFTGTKFANGAVGNFDNTISPYGLTSFSGIEILTLMISNSLNGIKVTADSTCPFIGKMRIGNVRGRLLDKTPSLAVGGAIRVMDDGPGLVATYMDELQIDGPIEWATPTSTLSACSLWLQGSGTIRQISAKGLGQHANSSAGVLMNGMSVGVLQLSEGRGLSAGINTMVCQLSGGSISRLILEKSVVGCGTQSPVVLLGGTAVSHTEFKNISLLASADSTGFLLQVYSQASATALESIVVDGLRLSSENSYHPQSLINVGLGVSFPNTVKISFRNTKAAVGSFVNWDTGITGTFHIYLSNDSEFISYYNNCVQLGSGTAIIHIQEGFTCTAEKLCLFGFGTSSYRVIGASSFCQNNVNGNYNGSQMTPQNGDEIYNSTGGAIPAGRLIRRSGAWTAI